MIKEPQNLRRISETDINTVSLNPTTSGALNESRCQKEKLCIPQSTPVDPPSRGSRHQQGHQIMSPSFQSTSVQTKSQDGCLVAKSCLNIILIRMFRFQLPVIVHKIQQIRPCFNKDTLFQLFQDHIPP